jgi:drug/metabolite transporter (DMT)-like permease
LYAYINPVIAVALGIVLLGESFNGRMAAAAALVLAGVAIVRWTSQSPARPSAVRAVQEAGPSVARRTA